MHYGSQEFLRLLHVAAKLTFNTNRAATQYQQNERGAGWGAQRNLKNKMGERCVEDEELLQQKQALTRECLSILVEC